MISRNGVVLIAVKLVAVGAVTVFLFILVINAMRNPVDAETRGYSADFTDASGLRENGDVRMNGLRIGKVSDVELEQSPEGAVAKVEFSLENDLQLTDSSTLSIKYQNLTGVRYIDVDLGEASGPRVSHLSTRSTNPSYDITELFNGLQPVLSTMNTNEINAFTENAISLLQGDGGGLGPMLDSTQKLAEFAQDRQQVISTLITNMSRISDVMGGRSEAVVGFLEAVNIPMSNAMTVLDEFPKTAATGPALVEPVERLLVALGISEDLDVNVFLKNAFHSLEEAAGSIRLLPGALAGLKLPATTSRTPTTCSNGVAALPTDVGVLLAGNEVVLCNAK
ncbi:MAG: MCE family protein [Gordonia sp.]|uniref:MlaD family protein n=1 Tax=Gordonia rubripertincta TaxID=36822 RepID=A0ABT4MNS1_GORRU|nr:MlaD family protein [Gordonia rubripertincta]MBA4024259.1 MCE family protein [Gordonia sp. (in: high G+C Gram-positive bacteria)]MCZ4548484.1 MlaD family protein [Gordonia rubripertincta]